ncbi:MAG: hypothetical protein FJ206_12180 [Gemmatimonadetes bacterium]|nr:hypothetical protein [Gemmatimonadota bacterium]
MFVRHRAGIPFAASVALMAAGCHEPTGQTEAVLSTARAAGSATPTVTTFNPKEAMQDTTLDVFVTGTGYDASSSVTLLLNGKSSTKVKTNSTTLISSTDLVVNVTIAVDATVGEYELQVANAGGKKGIGIEKFEVLVRTNPGQWDAPELTISFGQGSGGTDALRGDDAGNTSYPDPGHISSNGNLMFWLNTGHARAVRVRTTAFDGETRDRIFTNTHVNPGGDNSFGLLGMVPGTSGTAVLEAELNIGLEPVRVVRYGKDCKGATISGNRVVTTRSLDGRTWTIVGSGGVDCQQGSKKPGLAQVGTAGPFSMTLVWP